jgi:hypothetical protein
MYASDLTFDPVKTAYKILDLIIASVFVLAVRAFITVAHIPPQIYP